MSRKGLGDHTERESAREGEEGAILCYYATLYTSVDRNNTLNTNSIDSVQYSSCLFIQLIALSREMGRKFIGRLSF